MKIISATLVGRAVARSGLLPDTVHFLLSFIIERQAVLTKLLDSELVPIDGQMSDTDKLHFTIIHACLGSPEFIGTPDQTNTRIVPWQLEREVQNLCAEECEPILAYSSSLHQQRAANGAMLALMWINGYRPPVGIEKRFEIKLGALSEMFNNVAWILRGLSDVIAEVTIENLSTRSSLKQLRGNVELRKSVRRFSRYFHRLVYRLQHGLPDELLWMGQVVDSIRDVRISRSDMLTLGQHGVTKIQQAMDIMIKPEIIGLFRGHQAQRKAHSFREHCRKWHVNMRAVNLRRQLERAKQCENRNLLQELYDSRGVSFETVFEKCLKQIDLNFVRLDNKSVQGAPDYRLSFKDRPDLIVELKTKTSDNQYVGLNEATDVLRASELHGFKELPCLTVCNPNVDPGIITTIIKCERLCVIEIVDLAEGFLRLCQGAFTQTQFYDWVTQPGQALSSDLPFKQNE